MNDKNIKGIMIRPKEIKITQFADDTTIILKIEIFGNISGLRVNTEKTQIVWIGKKKRVKDKLKVNKELHWGSECFSLLGVNLSVNLQQIPSLNYEPALNNI